MNMPNVFPTQVGNLGRLPQARPVRPSPGSLATRQSRFEARSDQRWGNWWILEVPTALLWAADVCIAAIDEDMECPEPALIDLWP